LAPRAIQAISNSKPEEQKGNPQEEESTQQQEKPAADRREARKKGLKRLLDILVGLFLGWEDSGLLVRW